MHEAQPAAPVSETQDAGPPGPSGEWWHSSALTNLHAGHTHTLGAEEPLMEWRERPLMDEDDGDWSYSTAPGQHTMDILRDRFGETGFQDPPLWSSWEAACETASWPRMETQPTQLGLPQFRLASPRFRVAPGHVPGTPQVGGPDLGIPTEQSRPVWEGRSLMDPGGAPTRQMARPTGSSVRRTVGPGDPRSPPMADILQGTGWPLGPPIPATFDGNLDHLAMFLSQVISHLDRYALCYPSQWAMVVAIMAGLQGEAAEWAANRYSDHARELAVAGLFLKVL